MKKIMLFTALTGLVFVSPVLPAHAIRAVVPQPVNDVLETSLLGVDGSKAGVATFKKAPKGILVTLTLDHAEAGWHGVHFHQKADCSDHDMHFKASGGHMAAEGEEHGYFSAKGPHKGDLPNIWVYKDGTGNAQFFTDLVKFEDLSAGSALMIHAGADDYTSQPAGNAGDRIACGVIKK